MMRKLFLALMMASAAVLMPACGKDAPTAVPGTLQYSEEARLAYERAMRPFYDRDWEEAERRFQRVRQDYGQSRYARWAELRLADIMFEREQFAEAIGAYKAFVQSRRLDPGITYAQYRVCRSLFSQISDTLLLPSQEERDQGQIMEAYKELIRFKKENPVTRWDEEVDYMLLDVTGRLVRYELYVARFYLARDNFEAASARARYALTNYENSGLEPEALILLGETYLKMKKRKEAREVFERVLSSYPESPFGVTARAFLSEMSNPRVE